MQDNYRITVASSEKKLKDGDYDVWDFKTVTSGKYSNIKYEGTALEAGTRYYWQVTVVNKKGETVTSSETAYFETGLMNSGWDSAKWLSVNLKDSDEEVYLTRFTMDFDVIITGYIGTSNDITVPLGITDIASGAFNDKVTLRISDNALILNDGAVPEGSSIVADASSVAHEYARKNNIFFTYTDAENVLTADYNDDSAVNVKDLLRLKKHTADQNGISILRQAKLETVSGFNAEAITDLCKRIMGLIA